MSAKVSLTPQQLSDLAQALTDMHILADDGSPLARELSRIMILINSDLKTIAGADMERLNRIIQKPFVYPFSKSPMQIHAPADLAEHLSLVFEKVTPLPNNPLGEYLKAVEKEEPTAESIAE